MKMAAERQSGATMEENKENERPLAGGKTAALGDTLGLESILTPGCEGGRGCGRERGSCRLTCQCGSGTVSSTGGSWLRPAVRSHGILQIIKESQQQHGMRHGDFQRYRVPSHTAISIATTVRFVTFQRYPYDIAVSDTKQRSGILLRIGKYRVTKRSPALSNPIFTLVTSEHIAGSVSHADPAMTASDQRPKKRGYCSRRLRRLRKTLNFKMGNRHKFTGKKVTVEMLADNRYLLLVLMDAERAWSYAMQLKTEANTEPRKRFHLVSRLRKAVKHGEDLERLCESDRVDAKTKLEAQDKRVFKTSQFTSSVVVFKSDSCLTIHCSKLLCTKSLGVIRLKEQLQKCLVIAADKFLKLLVPPTSPEQQDAGSFRGLQLCAYSAYLNGMLQFELQRWQEAMKAFNKCKSPPDSTMEDVLLIRSGTGNTRV
ncbi:unnamed protein product [Ranitomeya imitator]|uniref:Signal recognition particle subunit SRP68 n=1 Tax=Ranitomeya imitator TaxID=111125 RepID=A0ABN9LWE4_9NEOB|nr:unnamed protein product [Ranitomeya imitator]